MFKILQFSKQYIKISPQYAAFTSCVGILIFFSTAVLMHSNRLLLINKCIFHLKHKCTAGVFSVNCCVFDPVG